MLTADFHFTFNISTSKNSIFLRIWNNRRKFPRYMSKIVNEMLKLSPKTKFISNLFCKIEHKYYLCNRINRTNH